MKIRDLFDAKTPFEQFLVSESDRFGKGHFRDLQKLERLFMAHKKDISRLLITELTLNSDMRFFEQKKADQRFKETPAEIVVSDYIQQEQIKG